MLVDKQYFDANAISGKADLESGNMIIQS